MSLQLKRFQQQSLEALRTYLERARLVGAEQAFMQCAEEQHDRIPLYRKVEGFETVPYVCLRLPTGGGKTLLAAHTVRAAASAYLEQDYPTVLWLVPTNAIRTQTLAALRDPAHPYRRTLDDAFQGRVAVFDVGEVERIRPKDLFERTCIVVGTLATLRVTDTDGRKVYAHNENFEFHFTRVPKDLPGLETIGNGDHRIRYSFANLLRLHRPLVVMDEAHNARTALTFEVLQRISPACVVEFTATPDPDAVSGSNVLHRVSASELKAEHMIKLPIMLTEHQSWERAVADALGARRRLADLARTDARYIRPLVLFQAESKDKPVTVDVLRQHLIDNERVPAERIAVATGDRRELEGVDLLDPQCPIEAIITMQALKEGWDCSFAYVFCSVAAVRSTKDVEQLLGRILRLPYAEERSEPDLNRAYAHVASPDFAVAARQLQDALVGMGFQDEEARQYVQQEIPGTPEVDDLPLFSQPEPLTLHVSEPPDLSAFTDAERRGIAVETQPDGTAMLTVSTDLTSDLERRLLSALSERDRQSAERHIARHKESASRRRAPSQQGDAFSIPQLCLFIDGDWELAERELFLDLHGWDLLSYPATLPELRFEDDSKTFVFDIEDGRLVWRFEATDTQMPLAGMAAEWDESALVLWLDRQVHPTDLPQEVTVEFVRKIVDYLRNVRHLDLPTLVQAKYVLAKVIGKKIDSYREDASRKAYQAVLFRDEYPAEVRFEFGFIFKPDQYPANWFYRGSYVFKRHYYPIPGELHAEGEEFDCAVQLDSLPQVKHWVRNLSGRPAFSFWLPTAEDRFYPDFVALLNDGRVLVLEYKGAHLLEDAQKDRQIGDLWEQSSKGQGLFLMATRQDKHGRSVREQILAKIGHPDA